MFFSLCTLIIGIAFLLHFYDRKWSSYWKRRGVQQVDALPFTSPKALFRSFFFNWYNVKKVYDAIPEADYIGFYRFRTPVLLIRQPKLINLILNQDFPFFRDKRPPETTDHSVDPLAQHLIGLTGSKWKSVRTKLTPAFTSGKIRGSLPLIEECVNAYIEYLLAAKGPVDTVKANTDLIMDIIASYGFGVRRDDANKICEIGLLAIQTDFWSFFKRQIRMTFPRFFIMMGLKGFNTKVTEFFTNFVSETFEARKRSGIYRSDFIQLLMELIGQKTPDGLEFDDGLLTAQAYSFFVAGFETSTFTQSAALYELAANPHVAQLAREDVCSAIEKHGQLNYEALQDMTYLHQVLQETMRIHPADYATPRLCTKDYKIPDTEILIEAGTQIAIPMMAIQNDAKFFPEPELFKPERFNKENKANIVNGSYLPFGDGPRKCIAMRFAQLQVKYAIARVLQKFNLELDPLTPNPLRIEEYARTSRYKGQILINYTRII